MTRSAWLRAALIFIDLGAINAANFCLDRAIAAHTNKDSNAE
jgi:hypothetical protein